MLYIDQFLLTSAINDSVYRHNVAAVFVDKDKKILLCQRAADKKFKPNLWHLPGGKIEDGESPSKALAREIQEELSILCDVIRYTGIEYDHLDEMGRIHRTSFFFCQGIGMVQTDFETQATQRFHAEDMKDLFLYKNKDTEYFTDLCLYACDLSRKISEHYLSKLFVT